MITHIINLVTGDGTYVLRFSSDGAAGGAYQAIKGMLASGEFVEVADDEAMRLLIRVDAFNSMALLPVPPEHRAILSETLGGDAVEEKGKPN